MVIYVAWHPNFADGERLARVLYDHYRRKLYENVAGGAGLPVVYRSVPAPDVATPIDVDLIDAETSAIILLIDKNWVQDPSWTAWGKKLAEQVEAVGLAARVFPVAIDSVATQIGLVEQAARWDKWKDLSLEARQRRLIVDLTYQLCRMLRAYLEHLKRPAEAQDALVQYLKKVEIFLSHSKHDRDGERIAKLIRKHLYESDGLASFFDVHDIPIGLQFNRVILQKVKVSAVVAIHTDSYSSREWCRREIIEAKRWNVPLVIANCIRDFDERGFPYLGNVPVVRMDPVDSDRIDVIVSKLLDEVLKDFLWRCWVQSTGPGHDGVVFVPRPPELITLASLEGKAQADVTLVYPEPPIGAEEQRLFEVIAPKVQLRSMTEWLAGRDV
ncbi:toll/interleukin-1 receptor domain-containing protein [Mesorhizobium sp. M0145]|uniref:toll/interleukin-1 receptor domain-containing protein n=1 Tax=Mesorhizobium sp. M0145 TaxID=2956895 RepID=UPI00333B42C7